MNGFLKLGAMALIVSMGTTGAANAAPIVPGSQSFEDFPGANFGGSGIPTDPTAFSVFTDPNTGDILTLALSATQRFNNPALGNDGAGTYSAVAGQNDGTPGSTSGTLGTTWNFNWFIGITGPEITNDNDIGANAIFASPTSTIESFGISLLYDMDPGVGTSDTELGVLTAAALSNAALNGTTILSQNSQNLDFGFLASDIAGFIVAPAIGGFNPLAGGEYSFALRSDLGEVAINVNVTSVPAPAALPLFGIGLGTMLLFSRMKGRKSTTS